MGILQCKIKFQNTNYKIIKYKVDFWWNVIKKYPKNLHVFNELMDLKTIKEEMSPKIMTSKSNPV